MILFLIHNKNEENLNFVVYGKQKNETFLHGMKL